MENVLELKNITKRYPGVLALNNVSAVFHQGQINAIMGENGAGKSTLMKVLSGAIQADEGEIVYCEKHFKAMNPSLAHELHIEIIYQEFSLFPSLSVAENIFIGNPLIKNGMIDRKGMNEACRRMFHDMHVTIDPKAIVRSLSVAEMQFVEIAKALHRGAEVLIMDEPTAPLSVQEVDILFDIVRKLKAANKTIIYISHRMNEIFTLCDNVTVMRNGEVVAQMETDETSREALIRLMIGRDVSESYPPRPSHSAEVVLDVQNLCGNGDKGITFQLHRGEILGISGLVGSGRTEFARLLCGADPIEAGRIVFNGREIHPRSPHAALEAGIALLPEDRKVQGLFLNLSVAHNTVITNIDRICHAGIIDRKKEAQLVQEQIQALKIATPSQKQKVKNLSGGNQQKVVLAKWLVSNVSLMIFDEPTRGIDVGAKQEIYNLMNELTQKGISIIMISSDMEEMIGMSDRILVLYEGSQMGILEKEDFSQEAVLTLASGIKHEEADKH